MQLNELVKDYSIDTISQKTKIPKEVLEKLIEKDWKALKSATKAKGFLKIIEREFDVDFSEIKNEIDEFFSSNKDEIPNRPIDLVDAQSVDNSSKVVTNILGFIAIIFVLYAIWFYFFKPKQIQQNSTQDINKSGLVEESINKVKNIIGSSSSSSTKANNTTTQKEESIDKKSETNNSLINSSNNTTKIEKKFDITMDVKKSEDKKVENEINSSAKEVIKPLEENNTIKQEVETLLVENKSNSQKSKESITQNIADDNMSNNLQTSNSEENISISEDKNQSVVSNEINSSNIDNNQDSIKENLNEQARAIDSFTIDPRGNNIWIGIYDIDKNKRYVKVTNVPYTFKNSGDKIAVVTGHNKFKIVTNTGVTKNFSKKGQKSHKVYILISDGKIKELNEVEYKRVTKRRAW